VSIDVVSGAPGQSRAAALPGIRMARWGLSFARRKPLGFLGGLIVLGFLVIAVFAPVLAPYDPDYANLRHSLRGSSSEHLLGTDRSGHDTFSRILWGARLSMIVGFGAVLISAVCATVIGLVTAYSGRWVDMIVGRLIDAMLAMPGLLVLITILGIARRTDTNMVLAMLLSLGLLRIAPLARIYRSAVVQVRSRPFVEAAESAGAGKLRIMFRHVLPNIVPLIIVTSTIALPATILAEASLSFLGFGPTGESSWGQMLSVDGRLYFRQQPGLAIYPGLAIFLSVFGFNMLGDALRDILDPRLRGSERR
jgi:peptide/nickel transport system permease protein